MREVPTSLGVDAETLDRRIAIGRQLLLESDQFQQLSAEIGGAKVKDRRSKRGETFDFGGVRTQRWQDDRQAFDPAEFGVDEKICQGKFQFNEVFTGWRPQVVLANQSGAYDRQGLAGAATSARPGRRRRRKPGACRYPPRR